MQNAEKARKFAFLALFFLSICLKAQTLLLHHDNDYCACSIDYVDSITITFDDIPQEKYIPSDNESSMFSAKTSNVLKIWIPVKNGNYICYPISKRTKEFNNSYPCFYDNWGIGKLEECERIDNSFRHKAYLFRTGEAECALSVGYQDDTKYQYVGGAAHGFEIVQEVNGVRQISFTVDGKKYLEDENFDLMKVNEVKIEMRSILFVPYSNDTPFAEVVKKWIFRDGAYEGSVNIKFLRDTNVKYSQLGMMCTYRHLDGKDNNPYLSNYAVKGTDPDIIYKLEDGWEKTDAYSIRGADNKCYSVTEYGDYGLTFTFTSLGDSRLSDGGFFVWTNNSDYNKIYLSMNSSGSARMIKEGTVLFSNYRWSIK